MWQFLADLFVAVLESAAALTILAGGILVIWRCAVYYVNAEETKKKLANKINEQNDTKKVLEAAERDLATMRTVTTLAGFIFYTHDPEPRFPVCPVCFADHLPIRMAKFTVPQEGGYWMIHGFSCPKCKCCLEISIDEMPLFKSMGHRFVNTIEDYIISVADERGVSCDNLLRSGTVNHLNPYAHQVPQIYMENAEPATHSIKSSQ